MTTLNNNNDNNDNSDDGGSPISTIGTPLPPLADSDDDDIESIAGIEVETFWTDDSPTDVVAVSPTETLASDYDSDDEDEDFLQPLLEDTVEDTAVDGPTSTFEIEEDDVADVNYWLLREKVQELRVPKNASFRVPEPDNWHPLVNEDAQFHIWIDRSRKELWDQFKREVETFKLNMLSTIGCNNCFPKGWLLGGSKKKLSTTFSLDPEVMLA
jgi:hypothetical protein